MHVFCVMVPPAPISEGDQGLFHVVEDDPPPLLLLLLLLVFILLLLLLLLFQLEVGEAVQLVGLKKRKVCKGQF